MAPEMRRRRWQKYRESSENNEPEIKSKASFTIDWIFYLKFNIQILNSIIVYSIDIKDGP